MAFYSNQFLEAVAVAIRDRRKLSGPTFVGIDGPGCSGKSFLARALVERFAGDAVSIELDDFFIPLAEQSLEWSSSEDLSKDVPHLRFREIQALLLDAFPEGRAVSFRPYQWEEDVLGPSTSVLPGSFVLVEGLYALHPTLRPAYDIKIWVDSRRTDRMERVKSRSRTSPPSPHRSLLLRLWDELYVPREQAYIAWCDPQQAADLFVFGAGLENTSTQLSFAWQNRGGGFGRRRPNEPENV